MATPDELDKARASAYAAARPAGRAAFAADKLAKRLKATPDELRAFALAQVEALKRRAVDDGVIDAARADALAVYAGQLVDSFIAAYREAREADEQGAPGKAGA